MTIQRGPTARARLATAFSALARPGAVRWPGMLPADRGGSKVRFAVGRFSLLAASLLWSFGFGSSSAQDDMDESQATRRLPGLLATVTFDAGEVSTQIVDRIDTRVLAGPWNAANTDRNRAKVPRSIRWRGYLHPPHAGKFRIGVAASGSVMLRLAGEGLLRQTSQDLSWMTTELRELDYAPHEFELEYLPRDQTQLTVYWECSEFRWEPLSSAALLHAPLAPTPSSDIVRGYQLAKALRCRACHGGFPNDRSELANDRPHETPSALSADAAAPTLVNVASRLRREWLVTWLTEGNSSAGYRAPNSETRPPPASPDPTPVPARKMPRFALDRAQAESLAAYLWTPANRPADRSDRPGANEPTKATGIESNGDAERGQRLFLSLGCLACHSWNRIGKDGWFGGGDLSRVARKRPASFFERWLRDPGSLIANHRMPRFPLRGSEAADLAAFLQRQDSDSDSSSGPPVRSDAVQEDATHDNDTLREQGRQLFKSLRCNACHETATEHGADLGKELHAGSSWNIACTSPVPSSPRRPSFDLNRDDRQAIQTYFASAAAEAARLLPSGEELILQNNCLGCHERDSHRGLAPALNHAAREFSELGDRVSAMTPPSLTGVGAKLTDNELRRAILRDGADRRTYLDVRMPVYPRSETLAAVVGQHWRELDRTPEEISGQKIPSPLSTIELPASAAQSGAKLVTADGFGCTSCHQIGNYLPTKAPVNARGPSLSGIGSRIRREWFERLLRNPLRVLPGVEMPSVRIPVAGVLDDRLDTQIAALWQILNTPGFEPPDPQPVQILARSGIQERHESAVVLSDVIRADGKTVTHGLLLALPNRHNFLFDLRGARLARWSIGDAARQRTQGKSWFWEAWGDNRLAREGEFEPSSLLTIDGWQPVAYPLGLAALEEWSHSGPDGAGVSVTWRQQFRAPDGTIRQFRLHAEWRPMPGALWAMGSAWTLHLRSIDDTDQALSMLTPDHLAAELRPFLKSWQQADGGWQARFEFVSPALAESRNAAVDESPRIGVAESIELAPGIVGERFALSNHLMPTALAWDQGGRLYLSSLHGPVFRIEGNSGAWENLQQVSDPLAAPFGLAADKGSSATAIDVSTKFALLRLLDADGDGRFERCRVIASGWGYTNDYHDWAVGLPNDEQGNYYLALACQQDSRTAEEARLRGTVVKLVPRQPTRDDPQLFNVEPLSKGHRFPMGIARNRAGELFVTDNQGNYNPFNELNHVKAGRHFGFVNAIDARSPPLPPESVVAAAIEIPHPWTRSVNGICFLEGSAAAEARFGPWAGHLVGCEYDTRRLIRMSLQQVGDVLQGAAYPLTVDQPRDETAMLGPICAAVSPEGRLVIGSLRDSGWGAGNNLGEIVRVDIDARRLPAGIAEVRAIRDGFRIRFSQPVDRERALRHEAYSVSSYRRIPTPAYGGPDQDRREVIVANVLLSDDGLHSDLILESGAMRAGFVYEIHLRNIVPDRQPFFPADAYYTLRKLVDSETR